MNCRPRVAPCEGADAGPCASSEALRAAVLGLAFALAIGVGAVSVARADDVRLESDSSFQAYEVRSPGTTVFYTRRRLVTALGLSWAHALVAQRVPPATARARQPRVADRVPRLSATLRLRLTQEFGDTCLIARELCVRATDQRDLAAYQPLARDTWVDVPTAYVEAIGLPLGFEVRLGRQLHYDVIGMLRADGLRVRAEPWPWLALEALGGLMVRDTSLGGSYAFEPIGAPRLDLAIDASRVPYVLAAATTPIAHAALELGRTRIVRGRLAYRETWELAEPGVDSAIVSRRVSLGLASEPLEALRLEADGVLDLLDTGALASRLIAAHAGVTVRASEDVTVAARVEREVPRFDPGSIWAYFTVAPISEAQLDTTWRVSERLELGGALRGRHAELGGNDGSDIDLGAEGRARTRFGRLTVGGSAFVWSGDLGPMAGVLVDGALRVSRALRFEARVSVWHFDDANRPELYGATVSEVLGVNWQVGDATTALVEIEHAASRVVGQRFRAVLALRIEAWR